MVLPPSLASMLMQSESPQAKKLGSFLAKTAKKSTTSSSSGSRSSGRSSSRSRSSLGPTPMVIEPAGPELPVIGQDFMQQMQEAQGVIDHSAGPLIGPKLPSVADQTLIQKLTTVGGTPSAATGITAMDAIRESQKHQYALHINPIDAATKQLMIKRSNLVTINQFKGRYPNIIVPPGEFDQVRIGVPVYNEAGQLVKGFELGYSKVAKHKIEIAGSVDNYKKYLNIVRSHPELSALHMFAGPLNIDLAMASTRRGSSGASEREDILITQLHRWKGSPESTGDVGRMWTVAIPENPFVQLTVAKGGGMAVGKVIGGAAGYVAARYGPRASQLFNLAQIGGGTALAAPGAYNIYQKFERGDTGEAIGDLSMFGLTLGAGIEGYRLGQRTPKIFGKNKGLTPYESGFKKGMVKSKRYDPLQKEYFNVVSEIKQDLRLRNVMPVQKEPTFTNVKALQQYNKQKVDLLRIAIKNQLKFLRNRAQISGGAGTEKASTHDIDTLFRRAKDPVILEYVARKLGIDPKMVFDPHALPRTGKIISLTGAPKEPGYVYPSDARGIRLTEQFHRLSSSSMELAHKGRAKDISEAARILDLIYAKTGGIPKHMKGKVSYFKNLSAMLEQNPRIMDAHQNQLLYNSGLGKKLWDMRIKFYQKNLPKGYFERQFAKLTKTEKDILKITFGSAPYQQQGIPPSLSMMFSDPSIAYGGMFSLFTMLGSGESSGSGSSQVIGSSSPQPSRSRYKRGKRSSYYSDDQRSSSSSSSSSRSGSPSGSSPPPPSRSRYPSDSPPPPSSPPPSGSYPPPGSYPPDYPYYPYPISPDTGVPEYPAGGLPWFPPMGGKFRSTGHTDPAVVRYFDELAATRRLVRDVIL